MKLLIAVDNSEHSRAAVATVGRMIWPNATSVLLLTVVRSDVFLFADVFVSAAQEIEHMLRAEEQQAEAHLRDMASELMIAGLVVSTRVTRGDPRFVILDTAIREHTDLIVVGSHGRSGIKKLMLGSVASHVVTHARCSVLVVKRKEDAS
jgi:nucleotide-binding universal stress UspA family protein